MKHPRDIKNGDKVDALFQQEKDESTMKFARIICGRNRKDIKSTYYQLRFNELIVDTKLDTIKKEILAELKQEIRLKFSKKASAREWLLSAFNLYKAGNYDEALEACNCAIALAPSALAFFIRGALEHKSGMGDQALEDLRRAAKLGHQKAKNILAARGALA